MNVMKISIAVIGVQIYRAIELAERTLPSGATMPLLLEAFRDIPPDMVDDVVWSLVAFNVVQYKDGQFTCSEL